MSKLDGIGDESLRARLDEAHGQLRAGKHTEAVHTLSDAFLSMLSDKPEMLTETVELRAGRTMLAVLRWPALGANLSYQSVMDLAPSIEFARDHFSLSEAITYYEFTVDTALRLKF